MSTLPVIKSNARLDVQQALNYIAKNSGNFVAGGDLTGTQLDQVVTGIQGRPISPVVATPSQALIWDGAAWTPSDLPADDDIYNVKYYGAVGDGVADDAPAIQLAIDALLAGWETGTVFSTLYFPPGVYNLESTIVFSATVGSPAFIKFQIKGAGRDSTIIRGVPSTLDLFQFLNIGVLYIAGLTVTDMTFKDCQRAFTITSPTYSQFINCGFSNNDVNQDVYGIELTGNVAFIRFENCYWYDTGNIITGVGIMSIENSVFENTGGMNFQGGLTFVDNSFSGDNYDRNNPTGFFSMGPAFMHVGGGSRVTALGNDFGKIEVNHNFFTTDFPAGLFITGNTVRLNGGTFLKSRRIFSNYSISVVGNVVYAADLDGVFWDIALNAINNCICSKNQFVVKEDDGITLYVDNTLFNANNKNVVRRNVYRAG